MKNLLIFALFLTVACDAPQRTRYPTSASGDYSSVFGDSGAGGSSQGGSGDGNGNGDGGADDHGSSEPGFEECNLGHQYYGGNIGYFGVCQNSGDERKFKSSFAKADISEGTCFVPMHIQGSQSFNVGRAECVHNQANKTYYMTLYKSRQDDTNGVMVLKAGSVNAFMQCMSAKANYIQSRPGCLYDYNCMQAANQYASTVCNSFVKNHQNNYKQVHFND
ncbi:MAG: hypothetical protein WD025_01710 [Bacteriovoracaceae bacterium]